MIHTSISVMLFNNNNGHLCHVFYVVIPGHPIHMIQRMYFACAMNSLYTRLIILYEVVLIPLKCYTETINRKPSSINNYTREVRFVMQKKERKRILIIKTTFATTLSRWRLWSLLMLVLHLCFIFQKFRDLNLCIMFY